VRSIQIQSETIRDHSALRLRLRAAGLVLVGCNDAGQLNARPPLGEDWLADLFCAAAIFRMGLRDAVGRWNAQAEPEVIEAMPGVWLVPMPLVARRRRTGYSIAVIPTAALLDAEQLCALCQSAHMDATLVRGMLAQLPPAAENDIVRLAALVRFAHEDHLRLTGSAEAIESVGKQLVESYEEMNLLYTIIQSMTVQERPERFVAIACQELLATLPYAWIGTQLSSDHAKLKSLAGRLIIAGEAGRSAADLRDAARALLEIAQPNESMVFDPANNPQHAQFAPLGSTVIAHPVTSDDEVIGVLIAGEKRGPDTAASSVDTKLLGATASHMAIFLENAALYEDLGAMFLGTLEALTASIDAKDRYTCGHSRRVAHLTQQLAEAIGLDEHTVSRCHIAGLVHDVGKIGVPEAVLLKPGKLTTDEFAWIRKHPEMGYRILKDIPQLGDILPGVLYHHERWDGAGYPEGLKGEQIPLMARLIGLADSFDAMSSNRTYRIALSREQVLAEIARCTAAQFDPDLARVFVKLDFSEFDQLVREHQAREFDTTAVDAVAASLIPMRREEAA
jgi:HD-GYP domain-containing protein (c-di-GMP phosphodiesterase class II)